MVYTTPKIRKSGYGGSWCIYTEYWNIDLNSANPKILIELSIKKETHSQLIYNCEAN